MWDIFDYSGKLVSTNRNLVLNEVFMQSSECLKPFLFESHYLWNYSIFNYLSFQVLWYIRCDKSSTTLTIMVVVSTYYYYF